MKLRKDYICVVASNKLLPRQKSSHILQNDAVDNYKFDNLSLQLGKSVIGIQNLRPRAESLNRWDRTSMETTGGIIRCGGAAYALLGLLLLSTVSRISGLSVTVNDVECIYEYVLYEGDTISGNFVVVDHDIFWSSDHPGIDFTVLFYPFFLIMRVLFCCLNESWLLICEIEFDCGRCDLGINLVLKEKFFLGENCWFLWFLSYSNRVDWNYCWWWFSWSFDLGILVFLFPA